MSVLLNKPIEYLKGVGPIKGELLNKELQIFTVRDLIYSFPFRYIDKTKFTSISEVSQSGEQVLLRAFLVSLKEVKGQKQRRLVGKLKDASGFLEVVWFKGASWVLKNLEEGKEYVVYGRVNVYKGKKSIPHPEMELVSQSKGVKSSLDPVYSSTEKLNNRGLDSAARKRLIKAVFDELDLDEIPESLPEYLAKKLDLVSKKQAIKYIHLPSSLHEVSKATKRLKFEELFYLQLSILYSKRRRQARIKGAMFEKIGDHFNNYYKNHIPFELTGAQKRVVKEIRKDVQTGYQMNRLLQGDVGSGKTMVALLSMLIALDNGFQACMMAPTEILAQQHHQSLSESLKETEIKVAFLSGSIKGKARKVILENLANGELDIIVGTHALIQDPVIFHNLGLAVIDEQHRFGVEQRSKLWKKNEVVAPHILVMTATPIPRTLAMTAYGDLDVSIIDELPPGRKPVKTIHMKESQRYRVIEFMRTELKKGRQVYVVFPLIEESETLDLENLQEGYERLQDIFRQPDFQISVVHGRMKSADKDLEMQRFVEKKTQIMVATTVIEVGVNVPNASIMVIENTERFGLSQLHQLRGRVGRGAEQSYCILMSGLKLSNEGKERIHTMTSTNDGFKIAEADLRLRGPGQIMGKQQSGVMKFQLANLVEDQTLIKSARSIAMRILDHDPTLENEHNEILKKQLKHYFSEHQDWGRIS